MPRKPSGKRLSTPQTPSDPGSGLTIAHVPIDSLHEDPANVRRHGQKNVAAIRSSLLEFGQIEPLVVLAETGRVIGGNGRLAVMRSLGWTTVAVVRFHGSETKARALAIALNRTGELAEWDTDALRETLAALGAESFDVKLVGFDGADLEELIAGAVATPADGNKPSEHKQSSADDKADGDAGELPDRFEVLVQCSNEAVQVELIERLTSEGFDCRALIA